MKKFVRVDGSLTIYISREQYSQYTQSRMQFEEARKYNILITANVADLANDPHMIYCSLSDDIPSDHLKVYANQPQWQWLFTLLNMEAQFVEQGIYKK